jgi:hypothetical protein
MKNYPPILYLGLCENPDCQSPYHCFPVHAIINTDELPEKCECGSRIRWEAGVRRHNVESLKKKRNPVKAVLIALAVVLAIIGGIVAYYSYQIYREHSVEEMAEVLKVLKGSTCDQILNTMVDAGFNERKVASLLDSYPSVVHRIRTGKTEASPQFENVLKGVYTDYLLTGSWSVVNVKYHLVSHPDPFLVGTHPFQETKAE